MSAIAFIAGICLAIHNLDITWINRAGALITIFAVMLAASRFHEFAAKESLEHFERNHDASIRLALEQLARENCIGLSEEQSHEYSLKIKNLALENLNNEQWRQDYVNSIVGPGKYRIKLLEFYLVCFGTFLNGFGDYFFKLLKELAS